MRGWIFRIGIIAVIAIGTLIFRDRISGGASDLAVGDCFDFPTATEDIADVQHHPCNEGHTAEVFAIVTHPAAKGAPVLTRGDLITFLGTSCEPALLGYVSPEAISANVLDYGVLYPSDKGWVDGDREITCYAYRIDEAAMTSSVKKTP